MHLVIIKFIEVFTRAGLVVGVTYALPLDDAGRFSIAVTLVGLFAFAFNWERHLDIQRRAAGRGAGMLDRAISDTIPFWVLNQVLLLPVFVAVLAYFADLSALQILLCVLIVSGEHVANVTYHVALLDRRYWALQIMVAVKNAAVLSIVLYYMLHAPDRFSLTLVLAAWAGGQVICALAIAWVWTTSSAPAPAVPGMRSLGGLFAQHRTSMTHFQLGIIAVLSIQLDRLAIGALVPLEQTGIFFRHVLLVSFVYQFFNVASYNRILPRIFARARSQPIADLWRPIRREFQLIVALVVFGAVAGIGIDLATGRALSAPYSLSYTLVGVLTAGALLRVAADFHALICNARHREDLVLRSQLRAYPLGAALLVLATLQFGPIGAAAAGAASSALYLVLINRSVRSLPEQPPAAPAHG